MKNILILLLCHLAFILQAQQFPDSEKDGKYYTINGAQIWTVTVGKGDPIFLIAGGPGGTHYGLRHFDSLASTNTLVYFDGLGRGKSELAKNVSAYSLDRDIRDLDALRTAMGYDKIIVLGHSYGGVVAQGYAIKHPDKVKKLLLVSTFHSYAMWQENCDNANHEIRTNYPEVWDTLMVVREQGVVSSDPIHQQIYGRVPYGFMYAYDPGKFVQSGRKPYPNAFNAEVYFQMVGRDGDFIVGSDIGTYNYRKELKDLKMPVLIVAGRYDRVAVPWMMVKYKTYCPQATFIMFERSGHNPQVEEPQALFGLMRDFLQR
jgi:proline iminopeptidase